MINFLDFKFNSNKVIIVGNGGNLHNNKLGRKIDEFDIVIRFNHALFFMKDSEITGKKTDYLFTSSSRFTCGALCDIMDINKNDYNKLTNYNLLLLTLTNEEMKQVELLKIYKNNKVNFLYYNFSNTNKWEGFNYKNIIYLINKLNLPKYDDCITQYTFKEHVYVTSGFAMIFLCLYQKIMPYIIGFDYDDLNDTFYDSGKEINLSGVYNVNTFHDMHGERKYIRKLISSGIVKQLI